MRSIRIALLLLALPLAAWGQNSPLPPASLPSVNTNPIAAAPGTLTPQAPAKPLLTSPASVGRPHVCETDVFYPLLEVHYRIQGQVTLRFTVATDGSVKNVAVDKTSGDDGLDLAALSCAVVWRYRPAMQNGVAVEVPWKARVRWLIGDGASDSPMPAGAPHTCPEEHSNPNRGTPPDPAVLLVNTNADGTVERAGIEETSGDKVFDDYAVRCVRRWTYVPPVMDGKPIVSQTVVIVTWHGEPLRPDTLPAAIDNPPCNDHPDWAADAKARPVVRYVVGTDGKVSAPAIAGTSGIGAYDEYAVECVSRWTFHPGLHFGHPANVRLRTTIG